MDETLLWISKHLDNYHFNTPRARKLKREIEFWSVLPRERQSRQSAALLTEFQRLFCNNPFLEQQGLTRVLEDGQSEELLPPRDITGACADAYFLDVSPGSSWGKHYTIYPDRGEWRDRNCAYLSEEAQTSLLQHQSEYAEKYLQRYDKIAVCTNQYLTAKYAYILQGTYQQKNSPGIGTALLCVVFLLFTLYAFLELYFLKPWRLGVFGFVHIGIVILMTVLAILKKNELFSAILKGSYRWLFGLRFKLYLQREQKCRVRVAQINVKQWFAGYSGSITQSRTQIASDADAPLQADRTRTSLGKPKRNSLAIAGQLKAPWAGYSADGEQRLGLPMICLLCLAIVAWLVI